MPLMISSLIDSNFAQNHDMYGWEEEEEKFEPPNPKRRKPVRAFQIVLNECKAKKMKRVKSSIISRNTHKECTCAVKINRQENAKRFCSLTQTCPCQVHELNPSTTKKSTKRRFSTPDAGKGNFFEVETKSSMSSSLPGFLSESLVEFNSVRFRINKKNSGSQFGSSIHMSDADLMSSSETDESDSSEGDSCDSENDSDKDQESSDFGNPLAPE